MSETGWGEGGWGDGSWQATTVNLKLELSVSDNENLERGVFTETGQETIRDIIADNEPKLPEQYAYGQDGTTPDETDTELGDQSVAVSLVNQLLDSAESTEEWEDRIDTEFEETDPIRVNDGQLELLQTCHVFEYTGSEVNEQHTGGSATTPIVSENPSFDYTIPSENVGVAVREGVMGDDVSEISYNFGDPDNDGTQITTRSPDAAESPSWFDLGPAWDSLIGEDTDGFNFNIQTETQGDDDYPVDVIVGYDNRFHDDDDFDNEVHEPDGYLDNPALYPELQTATLETFEAVQRLTGATVTLDIDDTQGEQFIRLRIGSDDFETFDNTETGEVTTETPSRTVDVELGLSRYPDVGTDAQDETPRFEYNGQAIDVYELFGNPLAIDIRSLGVAEVEGIVPQGTITDDRLEEAGQLTDSDELLTRAVFAPFDVFEETEIRSSEKTRFSNP